MLTGTYAGLVPGWAKAAWGGQFSRSDNFLTCQSQVAGDNAEREALIRWLNTTRTYKGHYIGSPVCYARVCLRALTARKLLTPTDRKEHTIFKDTNGVMKAYGSEDPDSVRVCAYLFEGKALNPRPKR